MRNARSTTGVRSGRAGRLWTLAVGSTAALGLLVAAPSTPAAAATPGWTGVQAPVPANASSSLQSSSDATTCAAPGSCVSVGEYYQGAQSVLDGDVLANGTWTSTQIPLPANALPTYQPYFRAVRCPSPTWCTALGYYEDLSNHSQAFTSTLSNGAWTTTQVLLPPAAADPQVSVYENGLSCPAAGTCYTVGTFRTPADDVASYIDTLSGGTWTTMSSPAPSPAATVPAPVLNSIACTTVSSCTAVGQYLDPSGVSGLIVTLSGGIWTAVRAPEPAGVNDTYQELFDVSCPAMGTCAVVGDYRGADTFYHGSLLTLSGGTWTAAAVAPPPDAAPAGGAQTPDFAFTGVSCPTTQWCEAVGNYAPNSSVRYRPLVATLSGGSWTTSPGPGMSPADTQGSLDFISCSWPGSCAATGNVAVDPTKDHTGLVATMSGGTWTGNDLAVPAGGDPAGSSFINPPSCVAGACIMGGTYAISSNYGGFVSTYSNLSGYQEVASDGGLFAFGTPFYGSMGGQHLNSPIVGMAVQPDNGGYYEVASDGGLFAFGAPFQGSMGGQHLNAPIVGIAFDSQTGGYYEVASDGGIFAFGAPFQGSMGGQHLNSPIVGIAFDAATGGYYEVAADGGLFAFGAPFQGSMGGRALNRPIVGMTVDPATGGYYEVASDGGLFAFGAPFQGSMGGKALNKPVVGMAFDTATGGYYEVASDGGLFAFGAPFQGSMGGKPLNQPVVGLAFG